MRFPGAVDDRGERLVLCGEVPVQRPRGHAEAAGDLAGRAPAKGQQHLGQLFDLVGHRLAARVPSVFRNIYKLDEYWGSTDEALAKLGYPPNRKPGQVGFLHHA